MLRLTNVLLQTTAPSPLPVAYAQLMPLIILALLVDAVLVAVWYYVGVVLANNRVKAGAKDEFYQFIGTCIMVVIIIGTLVFASAAFYNVLGGTKLMSSSTISTLCTNIEGSTQLDVIGNSNSILSGPATTGGTNSFPGVCSLVSGSQTDITTQLDYPISAVSVIIANLTNQTAANLNYSFTIDAWLGFLSTLSPQVNLCTAAAQVTCIVPNPLTSPDFDIQFLYTPYAGYNIIYSNLSTFGNILSLSVESFIAQLLIITIFLYTWPYLLFGGILLRSTFLTRRLGGLLIAAALVGLLVFPVVFSAEYLSVGNGIQMASSSGSASNPTGYNSIYGYNAVTPLPGALSTAGSSIPGNYVVNFFVEPNIKGLADYYSCWPSGSTVGSTLTGGFVGNPGLLGSETVDIAYMLIPLASIFSLLRGLITGSGSLLSNANSNYYLPVNCAPANALSTFFGMLNAYGLIGVTAYLLPIINIIIVIASIIGLSGLFGGDTSLAGLSRLV